MGEILIFLGLEIIYVYTDLLMDYGIVEHVENAELLGRLPMYIA